MGCYRITKVEFPDGRVRYTVAGKAWFFWHTVKKYYDGGYSMAHYFASIEEAKEYIESQQPPKKTIVEIVNIGE